MKKTNIYHFNTIISITISISYLFQITSNYFLNAFILTIKSFFHEHFSPQLEQLGGLDNCDDVSFFFVF